MFPRSRPYNAPCRPQWLSAARLFGFWLLAFVLGGCAGATPPLLLDTTETIDQSAVERAAAPLRTRGATVLVAVVPEGDAGADFAQRLAAAGLLRGAEIAPDAIGLYISYAPRYSELRVGARWSDAVPSGELETIRQGLNEALRAGDPSGGIAQALGAIDARIAGPWWSAITPQAVWAGAGVAMAVAALLLIWYVARRSRRKTWDRAQYEQRIAGLRAMILGELETLAGKATSAVERVKKEQRRAELRGRLSELRGRLQQVRDMDVTPESYQAFNRQAQQLTREYQALLGASPAPRKAHAAAAASAADYSSSATYNSSTDYSSSSSSGYDSGSSSSSGYDSGSSSSSDSGGQSQAGGDW